MAEGDEEKWFTGLPDDYQTNETVQNAPDLETFVKQALDTATHVGNSIRIPGPDAGEDATAEFQKKLVEKVPGMYYMPDESDDEAVKALYQKLGKPADPKDYEIGVPDDAPDMDKALSEKFVEWADGLNLTKTQAKGLFENWNQYQAEAMGQIDASTQESITQLKAEWGAAWDQKMGAVNALVEKTEAPDALKGAIKDGKIGAETVKWLNGVAEGLMDSGPAILNQEGGSDKVMTPVEAKAQIGEIMARKEYWDDGNPQQKHLKERVLELHKLANPDASVAPPARAGFSS